MRFSAFTVHDHYPDEPRTVAEHYEQTLDHIVLAEQLGYESFWIAEHHFHEYGSIPNPAVMLAAASQRTSKIGLGVAVSVLPFHNPLIVAEDYAMVDVLSKGRLILGVGSGYIAHEFEGFGVDPAQKRESFDARLAIVQRALAGETVRKDGGDVVINVPAAQNPTPPIYMAALRKESAYYIGRQGFAMLGIPYASVDALEELQPMIADYERGWAESGSDQPAPPPCFTFHTYVAEDDATAKAEGEGPFDYYVRTRLYGKSAGWDEITERGYCLMGGVEACVKRLHEMAEIGIGHIALLVDFGCMGPGKTEKTLRLMADEVIPRFKG